MALTTRRGTGRFRCQKTDPGGVWSRLEPRGKALRRKEGERIKVLVIFHHWNEQPWLVANSPD